MENKEKYKIMADCKSYSEWSVDENGKLEWNEHDFEGVDIISYKVVDENGDSVFENESFEECRRELQARTK